MSILIFIFVLILKLKIFRYYNAADSLGVDVWLAPRKASVIVYCIIRAIKAIQLLY